MARIRTIKPEAFASESLAEVSLTAERTFFGLLTQADDHGRFRDQPAVLAGLLWSLRPEHGPVGVEDDLTQLAAAGLVCRYGGGGGGGKRYLHIVSWRQHQKITRRGGVRHPACPHHGDGASTREEAVHMQDDVPEPAVQAYGSSAAAPNASRQSAVPTETPGQGDCSESSLQTQVTCSEPVLQSHESAVSPQGPDLGPRNVDLGSSPSGGASAPAPESVSTQQLIGEYAASCAHRPPSGVLGHLGREVGKLLKEGIDPQHIRAGLARHRVKGLHPSTLPSLVHEAMNASASTDGLVRTESANNVRGHRAWANPADPAAAYAEEL